MHMHDYRATGTLVLDRVTPVIEALFGAFALNALRSDDGFVSIARIARHCDPQWTDVHAHLVRLAGRLDVPFHDDGKQSMTPILQALAMHFRVQRDDAWRACIECGIFHGPADLDRLFLLASRFNDGHNLQAITLEVSWNDDQQKLFRCGGVGVYISRELRLSASSTDLVALGANLRKALQARDIDTCASLIATEMTGLLASIHDHGLQRQMRHRVAEKLTATSWQ
ncbi:hypothetical protein [Burkholderia sp. Bp9012]|uniref:hypothetical protein n=1 Tax=Burkholderia sp. Bp9012 TaxID=2184562 RepID=UPI000F5B7A93|nr:hypothetical protein [Burkholderia sp. Bp9012]